jgi:hypothetical protein
MRTTIELGDSHRAALLRLAAGRGEKGLSRIVGEALEGCLSNLGLADGQPCALRPRGVLSEEDAIETWCST